jgi:hypothetical protein
VEYLYIALVSLFLVAIVVVGVTMDKEDLEQ